MPDPPRRRRSGPWRRLRPGGRRSRRARRPRPWCGGGGCGVTPSAAGLGPLARRRRSRRRSRRPPAAPGPRSAPADAETGTAVLCGLACARTAVPHAVQKDALSSNGISHREAELELAGGPDRAVPGRPLQGGLHQPGVQHVAYPQDEDAQDQQTPARAEHDRRRRVADEGEQVDATPEADVGEHRLHHPPVVARREAVVPAAQARVLRTGDAGRRAQHQRLDEAVQEDQRHPQARDRPRPGRR